MRFSLALTIAGVAGSISALSTGNHGSNCIDLMVKVPVNARNAVFNHVALKDNYEAAALNEIYITRDVNLTAKVLKGYVDNKKTYDISARYCKPTGGHDSGVTLFLTHGIGFDKGYWDFPAGNGDYSFVKPANKAGYHTFSIDRISVGKSTIPDPYEPQYPTAVAVNIALSKMLRDGKIRGVPRPKKLVGIGHSYGSIITNGVVQVTPDALDAIVLTGWSTNPSYLATSWAAFAFRLAQLNQPKRFGKGGSEGYRPNGYITWSDKLQGMFNFMLYPHFSKEVLDLSEATKMPFTIAEILTIGTTSPLAPEYSGPVLVLTGKADTIFCGGDCDGTLEKANVNFPKSKKFVSHVQPNTGHGINLHYNVTGAYNVVFDFLRGNGL